MSSGYITASLAGFVNGTVIAIIVLFVEVGRISAADVECQADRLLYSELLRVPGADATRAQCLANKLSLSPSCTN